jgi:hypothetical protein
MPISKMRFRKLRIAWSVFCSIAGVLLIVLWVRSYWKCDVIYRINPSKAQTTIGSNCGTLYVTTDIRPMRFGNATGQDWIIKTLLELPPDRQHLVLWLHTTEEFQAGVSHWFIIMPAGALAAAPWIRWRFSLRTLLIATTLVAVVLGLAVYAARK